MVFYRVWKRPSCLSLSMEKTQLSFIEYEEDPVVFHWVWKRPSCLSLSMKKTQLSFIEYGKGPIVCYWVWKRPSCLSLSMEKVRLSVTEYGKDPVVFHWVWKRSHCLLLSMEKVQLSVTEYGKGPIVCYWVWFFLVSFIEHGKDHIFIFIFLYGKDQLSMEKIRLSSNVLLIVFYFIDLIVFYWVWKRLSFIGYGKDQIVF